MSLTKYVFSCAFAAAIVPSTNVVGVSALSSREIAGQDVDLKNNGNFLAANDNVSIATQNNGEESQPCMSCGCLIFTAIVLPVIVVVTAIVVPVCLCRSRGTGDSPVEPQVDPEQTHHDGSLSGDGQNPRPTVEPAPYVHPSTDESDRVEPIDLSSSVIPTNTGTAIPSPHQQTPASTTPYLDAVVGNTPRPTTSTTKPTSRPATEKPISALPSTSLPVVEPFTPIQQPVVTPKPQVTPAPRPRTPTEELLSHRSPVRQYISYTGDVTRPYNHSNWRTSELVEIGDFRAEYRNSCGGSSTLAATSLGAGAFGSVTKVYRNLKPTDSQEYRALAQQNNGCVPFAAKTVSLGQANITVCDIIGRNLASINASLTNAMRENYIKGTLDTQNLEIHIGNESRGLAGAESGSKNIMSLEKAFLNVTGEACQVTMILELADGDDLEKRVSTFTQDDTTRLPQPDTHRDAPAGGMLSNKTEAAEIALGMLKAMEAAEKAGVVHKDLKPNNVMLKKKKLNSSVSDHEITTGAHRYTRDDVLVIDWGIAELKPEVGTKFEDKSGTWAYFAPERFDRKFYSTSDNRTSLAVPKYDEKSDAYAVGEIWLMLIDGSVRDRNFGWWSGAKLLIGGALKGAWDWLAGGNWRERHVTTTVLDTKFPYKKQQQEYYFGRTTTPYNYEVSLNVAGNSCYRNVLNGLLKTKPDERLSAADARVQLEFCF